MANNERPIVPPLIKVACIVDSDIEAELGGNGVGEGIIVGVGVDCGGSGVGVAVTRSLVGCGVSVSTLV